MSLTPDLLALGAIWYVAFLFSTTLHEAAHAFASFRLGDPTAYHGGQVSLNPLPHVRREPLGMVAVPLISYAMGGWMFGWASAPYDPEWSMRHPRRSGLMALAGPLANLSLVLVSGVVIRLGLGLGWFGLPTDSFGLDRLVTASGGGPMEGLAALLSVLFSLNLILFVFNLLPFPPLDGSTVIQLVLSDSFSRKYQEMMRQPMLALAGILVAWKLFGPIFRPILSTAMGLLYAGIGT